jgi:outer membrane protein assembly factor BamD (BamD/ComL family)
MSREEPKAPTAARTSVKTDRLDQELALLESARQKLGQGESKEALRLLQQYSSRFPQGKLKQEATILRVNALEAQGKATEATRLSQEFLRDNPDSAHKRRLGRELEK